MKPKNFFAFASFIFILVGTGHLLRLLFQWPMVFGNWQVPLWPSLIATVVAYTLGFHGLKLKDSHS